MKPPGNHDSPGMPQFDQLFSQLFGSVLKSDASNHQNPLAAWQQILSKNPEIGGDRDEDDNRDDEEDDEDDEEDDDDDDEDCCHRDLKLESFNKLLDSHVNLTRSFSEICKKD
jgi:TATA-binding protein-associated factor Taf7